MKVLHYISLFGLVGLLTGCLTPEEMGYLVPSEPVYATPGAVPVATPVATPVYNTSPAYYATPVSGYDTMTVYDGYHPGYGGPRHPHHREPPHGGRPVVHGGHGGHTVSRQVSGGQQPARATQPHSAAQKPLPGKDLSGKGSQWKGGTPGNGPVAGGQQPARVTQPHSAAQKPLPGKDLSGKGSQWKGGTVRKGGTSGKGGTRGKGTVHKR